MNKTTPQVSLAQRRTSNLNQYSQDSKLVSAEHILVSSDQSEILMGNKSAGQVAENTDSAYCNTQRRTKREARQKDQKQKMRCKVHEMINEIELILSLSTHQLNEAELYEFVLNFNGMMGNKLSEVQ
jgi:hypothetical protein